MYTLLYYEKRVPSHYEKQPHETKIKIDLNTHHNRKFSLLLNSLTEPDTLSLLPPISGSGRIKNTKFRGVRGSFF